MITIGFLADHLDTIPTLAKWFCDQWPDYYAGWSQAEMEQDFLEDASRDHLPIRLVAFEFSELVGTIVLRNNGTEALPEFQPELGGLYVKEKRTSSSSVRFFGSKTIKSPFIRYRLAIQSLPIESIPTLRDYNECSLINGNNRVQRPFSE